MTTNIRFANRKDAERKNMVRPGSRRGLILLVVLGMLAMFSLLTATYIIFSARSRQASEAITRREVRAVDSQVLLDEAIGQVLRGTTNTQSSLYGHSLGEDYYGNDLVIGKVLNTNATDAGGNSYLINSRFGVEVLYGRSDTSNQRNAQFIRIPVQVQQYDPANPTAIPPANPVVAFPTPYNFDDVLTGRHLIFDEGPLARLSFEIVRSFSNNTSKSDVAIANRNSLVIDLGPHLDTPITISGTTELLRDWLPKNLAQSPRLFDYTPRLPVTGAFYEPTGYILGYRFHISPRPRNGEGYGWQQDTAGKFNLNQTISTALPTTAAQIQTTQVPAAFQGNHRFFIPFGGVINGNTDEALDVADYHDYLLGYYPPQNSAPLGGVTAPVGIRPGMLNYLLNLFGNPTSITQPQARALVRILQRASLRPIPVLDASGTISLSGNDYAQFSGSNNQPSSILGTPIKIDASGNVDIPQLVAVFNQLINGPWDIDNDGDGIADSVWLDAGFGFITMPDGTLVKPLVALRIEDLDNRIDLNVVDSSASLVTNSGVLNDTVRANAFSATLAGFSAGTTEMPSGFGVGPAEIILQGMFHGNRAANLIASRYGSDNSPGIRATVPTPDQPPFPFSTGNDPLSVWGAMGRTPRHFTQLVELFDASGNTQGKQIFPYSNFGFPLDLHGNSLIAVDPFGQPIGTTNLTNLVVLPYGTDVADDVVNHPYEMQYKNVSGADFAYAVAELEPVLRFRDWDRNEMPGRLRTLVESELGLDEAVDMSSGNRINNDPLITRDTITRAITTVSSSSNSPSLALPQEHSNTSVSPSFNPVTRLALNLLMTSSDQSSDRKFEVLFPLEFRRGERVNLNRPFGNGLNFENVGGNINTRIPPLGNLTVDDPIELMAVTDALFTQPIPNPNIMIGDFTPQTGQVPYGANASLDPEALDPASWPAAALAAKSRNDLSRAELARHLYAMTMLVICKKVGTNVIGYDFRADTGSTVQDEDEVRARKIAQWAANIVDWRDRDAIMTRFEYDPNPFDGWDEDPTVVGEVNPATGLPFPVVWGCETPELLLTETFNFHDRRVKDTKRDTSSENRFDGNEFKDEDMDQARIPQGSTFIEVYATRGAKPFGNVADMHTSAPPELYNLVPRSMLDRNNGNDNLNDKDLVPVLDLGRLAPDGNPVWRVGISDRQLDPNMPSPLELVTGIQADKAIWDDLTFAPERQHRYSQNPNAGFRFDRVIWFANQTPTNIGNRLPTDSRLNTAFGANQAANDQHRVYYNRFSTNDYYAGVVGGLQGGQYAVVGPRRRTYVGAQAYSETTGPTSFDQYRTLQYFDLHPVSDSNFPTGFQAFVPPAGGAGVPTAMSITPPSVNQIREIVPILAAAEPPSTWANAAQTAPTGIGINISEPLPLAVGAGGQPAYYTEPTHFMNSQDATDILNITGYALDSYTDYSDPATATSLPDEPFDSKINMPLEGLENTGTRVDFRTAYLQRLADPTQPYDPQLNPYITVDWMPMDLTVFNGEDDNDQQIGPGKGPKEWVDPKDKNPFTTPPEEQFASRSKNGIGVDPAGATRFSETDHVLWSYGTQEPSNSSATGPIPGYNPNFKHIVLHRDDPNGAFSSTYTQPASVTENSLTLGYLNHSFGVRFVPPSVTPATQMYVGTVIGEPYPWLGFMNRDFASPLELMMVPACGPDRLMLEFNVPGMNTKTPYSAKGAVSDPHYKVKDEFSHLLNFFSQSADIQKSPNLYRIFDFVETPDPFIESKEMLDPRRLQFPETARELEAMSIYFPPFNFVTKELRAGRVNLNTVNNPLVWRSLMWLHSDSTERAAGSAGAFWDEWMLSRRGYGTTTSAPLDPRIPTQFAGVLQPADSSWISPPVPLLRSKAGVSSTLLRPSMNTTKNPKPAFARPQAGVNISPERDLRRNPFHRYQTMMRMPNLVSDNSNTFAVWVTMGYFEVDPSTLTMGSEYGIEQGTNERPRAFYIIDRSVPVDFVPGQDNDVRKMILLERVLR